LNAWFPNSHADVFVTRLLDGYRLNGQWHAPRLDVAAFYVDQFPPTDMAREQAPEHGIRIFPTVTEALRLGRASGLAPPAAGDSAWNALHRIAYHQP